MARRLARAATRRVGWALAAVYAALLGYTALAGSDLAATAADAVFGRFAAGAGALVVVRAHRDASARRGRPLRGRWLSGTARGRRPGYGPALGPVGGRRTGGLRRRAPAPKRDWTTELAESEHA